MKKRVLHLFYILSFASVIFSACESDKKQEEEPKEEKDLTTEEIEKLKLTADSLDYEVQSNWALIAQTNDTIFMDIKRLLQEISYTENYDVQRHKELVAEVKAVELKQFTAKDVSDTSKVDRFDTAIDNLVSRVVELKEQTPGIENHPLADELVQDIVGRNSVNNVLTLRVNYDDAVSKYNNFVLVNTKLLKKLGKPYSEWKEKPMFLEPAS